jgi:Zn-dependent membrane protease YugP
VVATGEVLHAHLGAGERGANQLLDLGDVGHAGRLASDVTATAREKEDPLAFEWNLTSIRPKEARRHMFFYLLFAIPPLILGLIAQQWVNRQFNEGSKVRTSSGMTGAQVCRRLLESGGLNVGIESIGGQLTDHYDPRAKVMRLSQPVGNSDSVAAVAVAAHETGHAFQDAKGDAAFRLRTAMVPAVGFASNWWMMVLILGIFSRSVGLIQIAVALFAAVVAFSLVTLPVEIGASRRALGMMTSQGILTPAEVPVARKVLTAAALTYVVAALSSIYQLVLLYLTTRE